MNPRWSGEWIYIDFVDKTKSGKTNIYRVSSLIESMHLGDIKWYARWRRYAFFPNTDTLYEQDCLRDIATFLDNLKEERKNATKKSRTI